MQPGSHGFFQISEPVNIQVIDGIIPPVLVHDRKGGTSHELRGEPRILGLGEVMSFFDAAEGGDALAARIATFDGMPMDGHAPQLRSKLLNAYRVAGPNSDHECVDIEEAREKLARGMWLMLRQGTSEQNIETLLPLVTAHTERRCLLVSDDRHPDTLQEDGHVFGAQQDIRQGTGGV